MRFALYQMKQNAYLGECLALVYSPTKSERQNDNLHSPYILLLIKSRKNIAPFQTLADLVRKKVFNENHPILLRIASECLFGVYGDTHCECEAQRLGVLREIARVGQGIYVHLPQEAQGRGLFYKAKELQLQVSGFDPNGDFVGQKDVDEAAQSLLGEGVKLDVREYSSLKRIFLESGLNTYDYKVIGDNPQKVEFLESELGLRTNGIHHIKRPITTDNAGEYLAKLRTKGFALTPIELEEMVSVLRSADEIPGRVLSLLHQINEDLDRGWDFNADHSLLRRIVKIPEERGFVDIRFTDLNLLRDVAAYDEFQIELSVPRRAIDALFENNILRWMESLRFERNFFYDLSCFPDVPTYSLKIRYGYHIGDLSRPVEIKFIYKTATSDKLYRIKAIPLADASVANLLHIALSEYERHRLSVFTHNVKTECKEVTTLIKRYSRELRTISLMGPETEVTNLFNRMSDFCDAEVIDDPSNYRYLDRRLQFDFDYEEIVKEELEIFRRFSLG